MAHGFYIGWMSSLAQQKPKGPDRITDGFIHSSSNNYTDRRGLKHVSWVKFSKYSINIMHKNT